MISELAAPERLVEDLRQADFHLPDRQAPVITGRAILRPQGSTTAGSAIFGTPESWETERHTSLECGIDSSRFYWEPSLFAQAMNFSATDLPSFTPA